MRYDEVEDPCATAPLPARPRRGPRARASQELMMMHTTFPFIKRYAPEEYGLAFLFFYFCFLPVI
jgi:hypothetical protein